MHIYKDFKFFDKTTFTLSNEQNNRLYRYLIFFSYFLFLRTCIHTTMISLLICHQIIKDKGNAEEHKYCIKCFYKYSIRYTIANYVHFHFPSFYHLAYVHHTLHTTTRISFAISDAKYIFL